MQAIHTYPSSPSGRTWVPALASLTLFPLFRPEALASLTLKVVAYWKIKTKTKTNNPPLDPRGLELMPLFQALVFKSLLLKIETLAARTVR